MFVNVTDNQVVAEGSTTLFTIIQPSPIAASVILKNSGSNTVNYRFQTYASGTWTDMGVSGSDYYDTLTSGEVKSIHLSSEDPKIQLIGNASGGATLDFSIMRYFSRSSGGPVPILNL